MARGTSAYSKAARPRNSSATGMQFSPASSIRHSDSRTPADSAPAHARIPATSEIPSPPRTASPSRPPSQDLRSTASASVVSSCSSASSWRAAPICATANRQTTRMKKIHANPM